MHVCLHPFMNPSIYGSIPLFNRCHISICPSQPSTRLSFFPILAETMFSTDETTHCDTLHGFAAHGRSLIPDPQSTRWGATASSLSFDREVLDSKWFIEHRVEAGALDAGIVAETAMLDSMLLAKSDAFVLTLASQVFPSSRTLCCCLQIRLVVRLCMHPLSMYAAQMYVCMYVCMYVS